jgi:hypothetical protein
MGRGAQHPKEDAPLKKLILISAAAAGLGLSALVAGSALASQGSGQSAGNRADDYVVICHYDRNLQGPNAGPHTITINANAVDQHLQNHVKDEGFVGDDYLGPCEGSTPEPTQTVEPTVAPD